MCVHQSNVYNICENCMNWVFHLLHAASCIPLFVLKNGLDHWWALCSSVEVQSHVRGMYCLHLQGRRMSQARNQLGLFFNPEMEAVCSLETWVDFCQTTQCCNPEDRGLMAVRTSNTVAKSLTALIHKKHEWYWVSFDWGTSHEGKIIY